MCPTQQVNEGCNKKMGLCGGAQQAQEGHNYRLRGPTSEKHIFLYEREVLMEIYATYGHIVVTLTNLHKRE